MSCTLLLFTAYAIVRTVPSANRPNRRKKKNYLLELGGTGCPIGSIRLHEEGVIVVLFHLTSAVHGPGASAVAWGK